MPAFFSPLLFSPLAFFSPTPSEPLDSTNWSVGLQLLIPISKPSQRTDGPPAPIAALLPRDVPHVPHTLLVLVQVTASRRHAQGGLGLGIGTVFGVAP